MIGSLNTGNVDEHVVKGYLIAKWQERRLSIVTFWTFSAGGQGLKLGDHWPSSGQFTLGD